MHSNDDWARDDFGDRLEMRILPTQESGRALLKGGP